MIKVIVESNGKSAINNGTDIIPANLRYKIKDAIRLGTDKTMGSGASNLILKALKLVYNVDEERIFRLPKKLLTKKV